MALISTLEAVVLETPFTVIAPTTGKPGANVACTMSEGSERNSGAAGLSSVFTVVAAVGKFTENTLIPGGANVPL